MATRQTPAISAARTTEFATSFIIWFIANLCAGRPRRERSTDVAGYFFFLPLLFV